ncbi:MAG: OmpA family protein [Alphaproteobacteria bacterium]|nr:OmpA family protein [Alphaproteobacteria bacterium]
MLKFFMMFVMCLCIGGAGIVSVSFDAVAVTDESTDSGVSSDSDMSDGQDEPSDDEADGTETDDTGEDATETDEEQGDEEESDDEESDEEDSDSDDNSSDTAKSGAKKKLSKADSEKKIAELKDNAKKMKEKEQSTTNKMLGAVGIGATGIGLMQTMSASAEQSADDDAERDMKAYLSTFVCNYGGGKNVQGGETGIELPGGNELTALVTEYKALAADLKVRKEALGMRPGIEAEVVLDKAESGLYDDVAVGKTGGAYTSVARALMDDTSADAAAWAQQKKETADKKKQGMILAAVGAIGSAVGNIVLNRNAPKERSDEINEKYEEISEKLEKDVQEIKPAVKKCPSGTTGTNHPDCTCSGNAIYNTDTMQCDKCADKQTVVGGACKCPDNVPLWDENQKKCIEKPDTCTPKCTPSDGSHLIVKNNCDCDCIDGFTISGDMQSCTCDDDTHTIDSDGKCVKKSGTSITTTATTPVIKVIELPADSLFEISESDLTPSAEASFDTFVSALKEAGASECKLEIVGYTDGTGSEKYNQALSEQRANAVKDYLTASKNGNVISSESTASGFGEIWCSCASGSVPTGKENDIDYRQCVGKNPNYNNDNNLRYAPCRKVKIKLDINSCKNSSGITLNAVEKLM